MIKKGDGYLRFLNSFVPSISVTYWKPVSISAVASFMLVAPLHIHSSFSVRNIACSMLMYISVLVSDLCPKIFFTWYGSLVLWYSIVPFQCLNVWKLIFCILGLHSFCDAFFRWYWYIFLRLSLFVVNMYSVVFGSLLSISFSLLVIGSILGLLFFSGVMFMVIRSMS